MSTQPMYIGQGLLKVDPALTGLLAPRDPNAQSDDVAAQANTTPDDRFAGLLAPPTPQQAPAPTQTTPPNFPGGTPSIAGTPNANRSLLGRVHDSLISLFGGGPEAPTGYEGLLTPEEIASTKSNPGLLGLHQAGASADQIRDAKLAHLVGVHALVSQQQQAQQMLAGRQAIYKDIGVPPTSDPDALRDWVGKAIPRLMAIGDYTAVERLSPFADKLFTPKAAAAAKAGDPYINTATKEIRYFDKSAGSVVPPGYTKMQTGSSGTPILFAGTKNGKPDYQTVNPTDHDAMDALVAKGYKPDIDSRTQFVQGMTQGRFDVGDAHKAATDFNKVNAPIVKAATFYPGFKAASDAALKGNPAAFKTLMSQMAAQLDPALQLRLGTLLYVQNIDPSFKGSFQRYLAEKSSGTLPPDQVKKVIEVVDAVRKEQKDLYETRRQDLLTNMPGASSYAPTTKDVFGEDLAAPTPGAAPTNGSYSPNNPFAKRKP